MTEPWSCPCQVVPRPAHCQSYPFVAGNLRKPVGCAGLSEPNAGLGGYGVGFCGACWPYGGSGICMGSCAMVWRDAGAAEGVWERRERMGRSALGCGNVWGLLARMGGARIWKSPGCMGAGKPAGCERHGGRIWSLWALTFFDANQGAPTGYGNGGPPEYMGSRMTWPPGRDLRTCGFLATSGGAAGVWGP